MNNFFDSELCKSEAGDTCRKCRRARDYRRGIIASFDEPTDVDFDCPKGKTKEDFPQEIEPNIFQMAGNFAKAMSDEARLRMRAAISARRQKERHEKNTVTKEEQGRRMQVCRDCQFFVDNKRCAKCGCFMGFKAKLQSGKCPVGKW